MFKLLNFVLVMTIFVLLTSCSDKVTNSVEPSSSEFISKNSPNIVSGDLSEEEVASLIYMRQEEKVIRDVYTVFSQTWNIRIFNKLTSAEQKHMDAIKRLLTKYNVPDPVTSDEIGVFDDPQFQQLFDDYVAQGSVSIPEALLAGQTMEQEDITALENYLLIVDNADLINVYTNLKSASEKHLAALLGHPVTSL